MCCASKDLSMVNVHSEIYLATLSGLTEFGYFIILRKI